MTPKEKGQNSGGVAQLHVLNNNINNHLPVPPPPSEPGGGGGHFRYTAGISLERAAKFTEMGVEDSYIPAPMEAKR